MRTKLRKYLGKELRYTGTIARIQDTNALFINIKLNGKKIADHQFVNLTENNNTIMGEELTYSFLGVATSYKRADGSRDYKIGRVHDFRDVSLFIIEEDNKQAHKRRRRI